MDSHLLLQMIIASLSATVLYSLIGFIPGTDETSVLMPVSLALILGGIQPIVVLSFFVSAFVTLGLMNLMPALIANLPGGVLSTPMIEASLIVKKHGRTSIMLKKAAVGSLIGVVIALVSSLLIAKLISPFTDHISQYASWIFIAGAIFLSLISQAKLLSLISIIPFAILFQGLRALYWQTGAVPADKTVTTSFFLGITVAPLLLSLFSLLNTKERKKMETQTFNTMNIPLDQKNNWSLNNPFKALTKKEFASTSLSAFLANFLFVLSPVGLIVLFGETMSKKETDELKQAELKITVMSSLAQATYLSGIMISIIALGVPIAPSAIGPGAAFFESPPVFSIGSTITDMYSAPMLMTAFVIGSLLAIGLVYLLATTFAERLTLFVLTKIPHEAMLALFISLVILLSYIDAGLINVFGILLIGVICGTLNRLGVGYGVQFMSLYAAPFIMTLLTK
ncbi:tripartite tricarboxylate transporter permease [Vagococcus vulneris]|uniref:Tripartite tricarboxylate transporter TctA family protein n=1 Tax=Vagococcus vulneris TaxID=1977869 RepID=A0A429ZXS6_9ENTE|nr:tripartite tricarboxylate transporter permease [Vagococcus vulneris]RST98704.1 tripartite tricarboxylate transporter TctA family protein [Vagococcus vulneris]